MPFGQGNGTHSYITVATIKTLIKLPFISITVWRSIERVTKTDELDTVILLFGFKALGVLS